MVNGIRVYYIARTFVDSGWFVFFLSSFQFLLLLSSLVCLLYALLTWLAAPVGKKQCKNKQVLRLAIQTATQPLSLCHLCAYACLCL